MCDARDVSESSLLRDDLLEHGREQHQVDELGIELRSAPGGDHFATSCGATTLAISATMCDGVECVGECHEARGQRDLSAAESSWVSCTIPSLMMREHTFGQLRVEWRQWRQNLCPAFGVSRDCSALRWRQILVLVDDVKQRLVNLSDVVKESDSFDIPLFMILQVRGVGEDDGVGGNAAHMCTCLGVVCVDGIEERLQARGGNALTGFATAVFSYEVRASENTGGEGESGAHRIARGKIRTSSKLAERRTSETTNALAWKCEGVVV
jgi:hypothetical protein